MVANYKQSDMELARIDYEAGDYKNLLELAKKHNLNYQALRDKIYREDWKSKVSTRNNAILQKVGETKEELAKEYLLSTFRRAKRYEKLIDASIEQQSTSNDGTPLLDVEAIEGYTRAEQRIHELAKSALRIPDAKQIDVTSQGQSLGDSFISAIEKLRASNDRPKLTDADLKQVLNAEIVE